MKFLGFGDEIKRIEFETNPRLISVNLDENLAAVNSIVYRPEFLIKVINREFNKDRLIKGLQVKGFNLLWKDYMTGQLDFKDYFPYKEGDLSISK